MYTQFSSLHIMTPQLESTALSKKLEIPVYLKMDALQPAGSFKIRGIGRLCSELAKKGAKIFISSSGGNAGLAVAYAGKKLGVPVKVVIPETTLPMMREKIGDEGAKVIVHGEDWNGADEYARELCNAKGAHYIPPFDHPLIWEGHSSLADEMVDFGVKPGAILLSVGGGGLFCGVLQGLHKVGWQDVPLVTGETEGAASFAESVKAGKRIRLKEIKTVATSLGAKQIAEQTFEWTKKHTIYPETVTDEEAVRACASFLDDERVLVEPACGASLALVYEKREILKQFKSILVVVCGGNVITRSWLEKQLEKMR